MNRFIIAFLLVSAALGYAIARHPRWALDLVVGATACSAALYVMRKR